MLEPALLTDMNLDKQLQDVTEEIRTLLSQLAEADVKINRRSRLNMAAIPYVVDLETLQQKLVDEKFKRSFR
jgi:hypothetical protein